MTQNSPESLFGSVAASIVRNAATFVLIVPEVWDKDGLPMYSSNGKFNLHVKGFTTGEGVVSNEAVIQFLRHVADTLESGGEE